MSKIVQRIMDHMTLKWLSHDYSQYDPLCIQYYNLYIYFEDQCEQAGVSTEAIICPLVENRVNTLFM